MSLPTALIARFARHLAEVRDELLELEARLQADPADAASIAQLRGLCHKLMGTAEGYGFAVIAQRAGELQEAIRSAALDRAVMIGRMRSLGEALQQAERLD